MQSYSQNLFQYSYPNSDAYRLEQQTPNQSHVVFNQNYQPNSNFSNPSSSYYPGSSNMSTTPTASTDIHNQHVYNIPAGNIECRWKVLDQLGRCYPCGARYADLPAFKLHLEEHHKIYENKKNLYCGWENCKITHRFSQRYKLMLHLRVHTGEKPYQCSICWKPFARKENMKIHYRTHTKEKNFHCKFPGCTKAFGNSSDRKKHSYSHATTKNFSCMICSKSYKYPNSLKKHKCKGRN